MASELSRALIRLIYQSLTAKGIDPSFVEANDQVSYDSVIVPVEGRDGKSVWQLELSFLSVFEEDSEDAALLQCSVGLPADISDNAELELTRLMAMLNSKLPLVGFCYLEQNSSLFFRHILMLSKQDIESTEKLVADAVYMIGYLIINFAPILISVASGQQSLKQAVSSSQISRLFNA